LNKENKEKVISNICPIEDCKRPTHKESKYCIFHANAEEKTEEEFKRALKEYINEMKEKKKNINFKRFIFIGYYIKFERDYNITIFKQDAFVEPYFKKASFDEATFEEAAYFKGANFKGYTSFDKAIFKNFAYFDEATFEDATSFNWVNFKYAIFDRATFEMGLVEFTGANFKGYTSFKGANFKGYNTSFKVATFEEDAFFSIKGAIMGNMDFSGVKLFPGKKLYLATKLDKQKDNASKWLAISFERAYFENVYLELDLDTDVLIDFNQTILMNTKMKKNQIKNHVLQEEKKEFFQAKEIYLLLKNNFHSIGRYDDESWAFKKEKDMDRKSHWFFSVKKEIEKDNEGKRLLALFKSGKNNSKIKEKNYSFFKWIFSNNFKNWFYSGVSSIIYGYGEKPWNVIFSAGILIFIFALLFSLIGIGNPEIIELKGTAIHQNSGNIVDLASKGFLKNNPIRNFPDSLYFSLITFTTLGYGDFRPLEGWGRILAGSEAFIGAFMMALFVYTFARRTGGR